MSNDMNRLRRLGSEFAVISVGVFVALLADEWRQSQRERADEADYVERLISEIHSNVEATEDLARSFESLRPALLRLATVEALDSPAAVEQVAEDLWDTRGWSWGSLPAARDVFDELVSTGRLALIQDSRARSLIADYYSRLTGQQEGIVRRRAASGLGRVAIGSVLAPSLQRDPAEGPSVDEESLIRALDLHALRSPATAELNIREDIQRFVASSNERARELIALLEEMR